MELHVSLGKINFYEKWLGLFTLGRRCMRRDTVQANKTPNALKHTDLCTPLFLMHQESVRGHSMEPKGGKLKNDE